MLISLGNLEIDIRVHEPTYKPEVVEKLYRQMMQAKQVDRERDKALIRLLTGQGRRFH